MQTAQIGTRLLIGKQGCDTSLNATRSILHVDVEHVPLLAFDGAQSESANGNSNREVKREPRLAEFLSTSKERQAFGHITRDRPSQGCIHGRHDVGRAAHSEAAVLLGLLVSLALR